jgi:Cu(I)/Ag(I) efflux system membrane fusion protein
MKVSLWLVALATTLLISACGQSDSDGHQQIVTHKAGQAQEKKILYYRSPMNPSVTSDHPQKDSMGMDYIPVYTDEQSKTAKVEISPSILNNLGVRTEVVKRSDLPRIIRTVGYVSYDQSLTTRVYVRASGWIIKAPIRSIGEQLKKGALLFTLYSPDLVTAEQEFIATLGSDNRNLIDASRERLMALGITDEQIATIKRSHKPIRDLDFTAPHSGVVTELNVREGQYVTPSTELMRIGDLSHVWILTDVFEQQANWVKVGDAARIQVDALPGQVLTGKVQFIYPSLDPVTRTLKVRLSFDNPDLALKPNMYVDAQLLTGPEQNALSVPSEAVIREGKGAHVIVALGDGRFAAHDVTLGIESGDRIQILDGLKEGERVVTSAQFLIDSQASLEAALQRLSSKGEVP